jgi:hypothetical protein
MESFAVASSVIVQDYLRDLNRQSAKSLNSMLFFCVILLQNSSIIVRFCLHCDKNAHPLSQLIRSLRAIVDSGTADGMIDISITSRSLGYVVTNPTASSIEIADHFFHACYKAQNTALKILVSLMWADILHMFTVAASLVMGKCCFILLQGMHLLVVLAHERSTTRADPQLAHSATCSSRHADPRHPRSSASHTKRSHVPSRRRPPPSIATGTRS